MPKFSFNSVPSLNENLRLLLQAVNNISRYRNIRNVVFGIILIISAHNNSVCVI